MKKFVLLSVMLMIVTDAYAQLNFVDTTPTKASSPATVQSKLKLTPLDSIAFDSQHYDFELTDDIDGLKLYFASKYDSSLLTLCVDQKSCTKKFDLFTSGYYEISEVIRDKGRFEQRIAEFSSYQIDENPAIFMNFNEIYEQMYNIIVSDKTYSSETYNGCPIFEIKDNQDRIL